MPNTPEAAVLLAGRITSIFQPRDGERPGRKVFVQTDDGAAVIRLRPEDEQGLRQAPLQVGSWVEWLVRYRLWVNDEKVPYLTKRFVREWTAADTQRILDAEPAEITRPSLSALPA